MLQYIKLGILAIVMLGYLYFPASLIQQYSAVQDEGTVYTFCPEPIDPYDSFRGRYVILNLDIFRNVPYDSTEKADLEFQDMGYVLLTKDSVGCTTVEKIVANQPTDRDYITVKTPRYIYGNDSTMTVEAPASLTAYFINEDYALKAEQAYSSLTRNNNSTDVKLETSVLDGMVVIKELYFEGKPVIEYLKELK